MIDITQLKAAEEALKRYSEELEIRVMDRTALLRRMNIKLSEEILERVRTERALKRSEETYRRLIENIDHMIFAIDPDMRFTFVNPSAEAFLGESPSVIAGRSFLDFIPI